ncbi:MAG: DUF1287 domain-containing protein, partial [Acidobacteriota bacterium]|nr:DUF1287 domain-containing protein [Acidobacteriota bacterium]
HRPEGEFAGTPGAGDVLLRWPVVGHFRWSFEAEPLGAPAASVPPSPPARSGPPEEPEPATIESAEAEVSEPVVAEPEVAEPTGEDLLVAGALLSVARAPRYDPSYAELAYPGGDVAADRGAAVDVVVRAFRHAGVDLQRAVHEDIVAAPAAYGIEEPDANIDHRRIRNLFTFFERRAATLSTAPDGDWAPGDVVFWDRNRDGVAGHLGILTADRGPSGELLVVHHHRPEGEFAGTPGAGDVLLRWPVVGHFRWSFEAAPEGLAEVDSWKILAERVVGVQGE